MRSAKVIEKIRINMPNGEQLASVLMVPAKEEPKRIVYIVPLVGARAAQQVLRFKSLARRGSALLSFEYRGHGNSSGTFSMEKSLEDSRRVLSWAQEYAAARNIPLHVLTTCYGTLAMLSWFKNGYSAPGVRSLSAVSGLFDLHRIITLDDFFDRFTRRAGRERFGMTTVLADIIAGTIDTGSDVFRESLREYLKGLFPELRVSSDAFEDLGFNRVDLPESVVQFSRLQPLEGVSVPPDVPCLFYYGTSDRLMGLHTSEGRLQYESAIRVLVPHAGIFSSTIDHFGRGGDHDFVLEQLGDFHETNEGLLHHFPTENISLAHHLVNV